MTLMMSWSQTSCSPTSTIMAPQSDGAVILICWLASESPRRLVQRERLVPAPELLILWPGLGSRISTSAKFTDDTDVSGLVAVFWEPLVWVDTKCADSEAELLEFVYCCCSVAKLCDSMNCSTPGFPVLHYFLEFAQTHVHWVSDAIQPPPSATPFSFCLQFFLASGQ